MFVIDVIQHVTIKFNWNNSIFWISRLYARCSALVRLELWEELQEVYEK